ncbi:diguanylate cyclase [Xanthobacter dioxanivorans]|uniref:diguanylate cyclase n=1 Tax=Xanthobacter dioxanivorans TaxID=2528964 RepID=A0A974PPA5_9HYPH|nr:diguanylate cyclase [Xanthobacter dioxanivorans]QRG06620.1 diguanylate cyclase [Xanthobacter dioxanivorans]
MSGARPEDLHACAERTDAPGRPGAPKIAHFLVLGSLLAVALVIMLAALSLWQTRQDTWERAQRTSENLVHSVTGYVDRHMRLYTLALDMVAESLRDSEFVGLSDQAKQRVLNTIAASTDYVGNVLELNAKGDVVRSARPISAEIANLADRDFFTDQRDNPHPGVSVSQPFRSRSRDGDASISFSRRLTAPDGSFAGVIVIVVRLAYIQAFFSSIDMGPNGALLLESTQGRILARQPPRAGQGAVGTDLSQTPVFKRMLEEQAGAFIARAATDGVERYYTFARIPDQPLILNVAFATRDIFEDWWRRSALICLITLLTCIVIIVLATVLRRELRRRAIAESELAFLSITDGLTGLVNRRRYDEMIQREWRRTSRTGAALALLMIDVDRFKLLNDKYGHARGDEVLKLLARVIGESIRRPGDTAARYGGEEFAVILPDTDASGAALVAETIRAKSESSDTGLPPFTVSIGVATIHPKPDGSLRQFQEDADKALYQAKAEGRNRVVLRPATEAAR